MIEKKPLFHYLKAVNFFADYAKDVTNFKHKIRGANGKGKPLTFTDEERKFIVKAVYKMLEDFEKRDIEDIF